MAQVSIDKIRLDGGTRPRAAISEEIVADYTEAIRAGDKFPPVIAFYDGTDYWLADGFHRTLAHRTMERLRIEVDVRQGTQRDAVLHSCGVNATHGVRRTNADKRRAALKLLLDEEWSQWSDREIARRCAVGKSFVSKLRPSLSTADSETGTRRYTTKHGTEATMRTENIGHKPERPEPVARPDPSLDDQTMNQSYAAIEAMERLASLDVSPEDYINQLPPYLHRVVEKSLEPAYAWLSDFYAEWRRTE